MIDKKKMCPNCAISFNQQKICMECLMRGHSLSKQAYKVLVTIANHIDRLEQMHRITRAPKKEIVSSINSLRRSGYIIRKGLTGWKVSDSGMNLIAGYRQVYGSENDVAVLDRELRREIGIP